MRTVKKIVLIMIFGVLFAKDMQKDEYLDYTNKVINYEFHLPNLDSIKNPFYEPDRLVIQTKSLHKKQDSKKRVKITLLAIFGSRAYIQIQEFLGEQLIKSKKEWLKLNDKIFDCVLTDLTQSTAVFKCKDGVLKKTLNRKLPMLKEKNE